MKQRVITAIIALIFFIPILFIGGIPLTVLGILLGLVGLGELFVMRKKVVISIDYLITAIGLCLIIQPYEIFINKLQIAYIIAIVLLLLTVFTFNKFDFNNAGFDIMSMLYLGVGFNSLILVRQDGGLKMIGYAFLVVWSTDIFAYLVGKKFGKHKLIPKVSPNKTIEGSIGGIIASVVFSIIYFSFISTNMSILVLIGLTILLSIAGQLGDLIESSYKRFFNVKDSGKILPGHGGILDRFDSMLIVFPIILFLGLI